jgi:hypothetical protein
MSTRNSLIINCPTNPFKPKSQNLFHKKRQMKDFFKNTLKGETENGKGKNTYNMGISELGLLKSTKGKKGDQDY